MIRMCIQKMMVRVAVKKRCNGDNKNRSITINNVTYKPPLDNAVVAHNGYHAILTGNNGGIT